MNKKRLKFDLTVTFLILIMLLSYLVATRELTIGGTDPLAYQNYFNKLEFYQPGDRIFERGYHYFNYLIFLSTGSYTLFLAVFFISFNLIYLKSLTNFIIDRGRDYYILTFTLFFGLILLSSWYQTATLNGLRQGFSLVLLYLSLSYLFLKSRYKFILTLLISFSFHDSTILVIPFILLLYLSLRGLLVVFTVVSVFYPLGINEKIIKFFSDILGLPVYSEISNYLVDFDAWKGFQLNLYIYSVFWCILFACIHFRTRREDKSSEYLLKTLLMLTCFYFILGFGSFSNRFGFAAWLFLPIIQTFYLINLLIKYVKDRNFIFYLFIFFAILGLFNYYYILRPIS